jgi:hypothetical protein
MAYTTEEKIEALMGLSFDASTKPSSTEITTIITWSDALVDAENVSASTIEKEVLSTLMAAHLIDSNSASATGFNFKVADLSINPINKSAMKASSKYLEIYERLGSKKRSALFEVVNG